MIIKLSTTTGEVLEVKDSPGIPFKQLADEFARRTKKIWKVEAEKGKGKGVSKCETQQSSGAPSSMKI
jgi:hypothetical protein